MVEKISDILFHPTTLIKYRKTNFFKVLLYLLVLTFFASIVPVIETIKFPGYGLSDKEMFEEIYQIDFSTISEYPNCKVIENKLECDSNEVIEVGTILERFIIVFDIDNQSKARSDKMYIKFTKDDVRFTDNYFSFLTFDYDELPKSWRNFDFEEIKNSNYPEDEFYHLFVGGINEIKTKLIGFELAFKIFFIFTLVIFEVLFYSLMFHLLVGRKFYKYRDVFRVSVFAYTFPVILSLLFNLFELKVFSSTIVSIITIIYIYLALIPKEIPNHEE